MIYLSIDVLHLNKSVIVLSCVPPVFLQEKNIDQFSMHPKSSSGAPKFFNLRAHVLLGSVRPCRVQYQASQARCDNCRDTILPVLSQ